MSADDDYAPEEDVETESDGATDAIGHAYPLFESSINPAIEFTKSKAFLSLQKSNFPGFDGFEEFQDCVKADDPQAKKYIDQCYATPDEAVDWKAFSEKISESSTSNKVSFKELTFVDGSGSKLKLSEANDTPQMKDFLKAINRQIFEAPLPPVIDPIKAMQIKLGALDPEQMRINQRFITPQSKRTHVWQRHRQPTSLIAGIYRTRRFPFSKLVCYPSDPDLSKLPSENSPTFKSKVAFLKRAANPATPLPEVCAKTLANCAHRSHEAMRLLDKCLKYMALDFQDPTKIFSTWKMMNRILKEATNLNETDMASCQDALTKNKAISKKLLKGLETKLIKELTDYPVLPSTYTDKDIADMPVSLLIGTDPKITSLKKLFSKQTPQKTSTPDTTKPTKPAREKPTSNRKKKKKRRLNKPQLQKKCKKCGKHFSNNLKKCDKCPTDQKA